MFKTTYSGFLEARWEALRAKAKQPDIGSLVDAAMTAIENENTSLRGKLDKRFGRAQLGQGVLGELIDLISTIGFADKYGSSDLLGEVTNTSLANLLLQKARRQSVLHANSCREDPCCCPFS